MITKPVHRILYLMLSTFSVIAVQGQEQSPLLSGGLEGYVQEGLSNNLALQQVQMEVSKSLIALREAKGLFYPDVSVEARYTLAQGGRLISIPVGDLLNPVYNTLNQLTASGAFPQINNVNEQFLPNNFHETYLSFRQPLFNTDIYYNYKAQQKLITVAEAKKKAYENELAAEIRKAYFEYRQAGLAVIIYQQTKLLREELLDFNQTLVANDKDTRDVVYLAEAAVLKEQKEIAVATEKEEVARAYFNFLLNRPLDALIQIDEAYEMANFTESAVVPLISAIDVSNRQELRQLQAGIEANALEMKRLRARRILPELFLGGQAGFQGFGYTFDGGQDYWLMQVGLSLPVFSGGIKKAKEQQAKLDGDRLNVQYEELRSQLRLQLVQAREALQSAIAEVKAGRAEVAATEAALSIIQKKYQNDTAILVELLDAQTRYKSARVALSIAHFNYHKKATLLQKALGNY